MRIAGTRSHSTPGKVELKKCHVEMYREKMFHVKRANLLPSWHSSVGLEERVKLAVSFLERKENSVNISVLQFFRGLVRKGFCLT